MLIPNIIVVFIDHVKFRKLSKNKNLPIFQPNYYTVNSCLTFYLYFNIEFCREKFSDSEYILKHKDWPWNSFKIGQKLFQKCQKSYHFAALWNSTNFYFSSPFKYASCSIFRLVYAPGFRFLPGGLKIKMSSNFYNLESEFSRNFCLPVANRQRERASWLVFAGMWMWMWKSGFFYIV